jgi:very-short-patch-repair endonuclease
VWEELRRSEEVLTTGADLAVARLAERQHGAVSTAQLRAAGLRRTPVDTRVRRGWLHRVHRGVYAVGHAGLSFRGRMWAAVLACGGADLVALSHWTAAAIWDLSPPPARGVDVTTAGEGRSMEGVRVHRSRALAPLDDVVRQADGLPVTTVARTLVDLAGTAAPHRLERLCHRAEVLRHLDAAEVHRRLAFGRRPGARNLRRALATLARAEPQRTRSELEERFLALVAGAGVPRPLVNARVGGYEVDFLWPDRRLVVETDGAATHLTPAAFEADRRRDAALQLAGFRVVRLTWRQVTEEPGTISATLRALAS